MKRLIRLFATLAALLPVAALGQFQGCLPGFCGVQYLCSSPAVGGWCTTWTHAFVGDGTGWGNATLRQVIPTASLTISGGTQVRVTLRASTSNGGIASMAEAWIGEQGGGGIFDFDGGQVKLLFSGVANVAIPQNTEVTSDPVLFHLDNAQNLVISAQFTGGASLAETGGIAGASNGFKAGVAEAANTTVTGYSNTGSGFVEMFTKVEVK